MKFLLLLFTLITFTVNNSFATVWRVNKNDITADFNEIKAAHDNDQVLPGDTLLVEGSQSYYDNFTMNKQLTIIGPGYFLNRNYNNADVLSANIDRIVFNSGSEGSTVVGLRFNWNSGSGFAIYANTINIERCYVRDITIGDVENIRIMGCYINGSVDDFNSGTLFNNVYLKGNIITGGMDVNSNCNFISVKNNIFLGTSYTFNAYHFRNNIVISGQASMNINSIYIENNIGTNNVFGEGNLNVTDINALFVGGESPDAKYQLSANSQAKGAGFEGEDCGIFGGDYPYVISGLPPLPIITELNVDDAASVETGLNVKIKVRSN